MRILLLVHAFNSLAQRLWVELEASRHELAVEFDIHDSVTEEAVRLHRPDVIVAPFLKRAIREGVWRHVRCLVVHPGVRGDRGPSALDWAIQEGEREWGVTVLEANAEMDAGGIWAWRTFPMREATKSSLYRNEVTEAAVECVLEALAAIESGGRPEPLDYGQPGVRGRLRPPMRQADRAIDWRRDDARTVLAKLRAADGHPGVLDELCGMRAYLYDARVDGGAPRGRPGEVVAACGGAILRATVDGGVWLGHLRAHGVTPALKLPATQVLGERIAGLPEGEAGFAGTPAENASHDLWSEEVGTTAYLHFPLLNGAMSPRHCHRLAAAIRHAKARPTRVIVLMGGPDFWSNGIDLNAIEASRHPADESWASINAIDDVALEILTAERHVTIAALQGNAGAGGVFLALAADRVLARASVILNPHYKGMGNLYGSEYWTYLLPKRVGAGLAAAVTENRLPIGARHAAELGLVDACVPGDHAAFRMFVRAEADAIASRPDFAQLLEDKRCRRAADEAAKPLARYRAEELERMKLNFYGFDPSYHVARYHFVFKVPRSRTPLHLARHRALTSRAEGPHRAREAQT